MKNALLNEKIPLLIIVTLYIITFILTYGHCGDLIVDCGREAYIPYAISQNKVLCKDIFCIYGAFPYLFNAFFYKIFSANLNVLYTIGGISGLLYVLGVYFCSREFLSKSISVCIGIFVIFAIIFENSMFNFIFPYSYAMVFSCVFAIWILYFLIKFIHTKNTSYMHACALLWGAICVSKIDFIPVILPIGLVFLLFEENKLKESLKFIAFSSIIPFLTYFILFSQGLTLSDIANNSNYIELMTKTKSFEYFYAKYSIVSFNISHFIQNLKTLLYNAFATVIFFLVSLYAARRRKKATKYILLVSICIFYYSALFLQDTLPQAYFALLPYICSILLVFELWNYFKIKEYKNRSRCIRILLLIFALACSIKNFHSMLLSFYGAYSFAPLFVYLIIFINDMLENNFLYNTKKQYEGVLCTFIIILTILFANILFIWIREENTKVKTPLGMLKAPNMIAEPFNETLHYLKSHSDLNESLLVMPEGIILNFLSGRDWNFYQTSFTPLDFETFGEDVIIKNIIEIKPQYIALSNRNTSEYAKSYICKDYGNKTCKYIVENYTLEAAFGEKFRIYLFKYQNDKAEYEEE